MRSFLSLLISVLLISGSVEAAKKKDKGSTPDNSPKSDTCTAYDCDDSSDRGGGRDDVDGTGSGYDGGYDGDRGGNDDGGGMAGELFSSAFSLQKALPANIVLTCIEGDFSSQVVNQNAKALTLDLGDKKVVITAQVHRITGERTVLIQSFSETGEVISSLSQPWFPNSLYSLSLDLSGADSEKRCQVSITL